VPTNADELNMTTPGEIMNCIPITYHEVSVDVFNKFKRVLRQAGVTVPEGNNGILSGQGFEADFKWEESSKTLTITVKSKPIFLSCGDVIRRIYDLIVAGTHGSGGGQED
jgi:hypothetical protein